MPFADADFRRARDRDLKRRDPAAYAKKLEQVRAWRKLQAPEENRCRHLRSKYGLTLAQRNALLASQGGRCKLCLRVIVFFDQGGKKMLGAHIDHCHTTGVVRGVLCGRCNVTIGYFKDDPARLRAAAKYLETQGNVPVFSDGTTGLAEAVGAFSRG